MRVLVTGSRAWKNRQAVYRSLRQAADDTPQGELLTVVHGACPTGADAYAARWCKTWVGMWPVVQEEAHPAEWDKYGKKAGFRRNAEMVDLGADRVLAFCRGGSAGTMHTVGLARKAGIPVELVEAQ